MICNPDILICNPDILYQSFYQGFYQDYSVVSTEWFDSEINDIWYRMFTHSNHLIDSVSCSCGINMSR